MIIFLNSKVLIFILIRAYLPIYLQGAPNFFSLFSQLEKIFFGDTLYFLHILKTQQQGYQLTISRAKGFFYLLNPQLNRQVQQHTIGRCTWANLAITYFSISFFVSKISNHYNVNEVLFFNVVLIKNIFIIRNVCYQLVASNHTDLNNYSIYRSEQAPGSMFHPCDVSKRNDCDFLKPSWCNIKVDPEK